MEKEYDVLILGAGPAGLTAALYAARYNRKTIVIGKSIGGTAALAGEVENWPGMIASGKDIMDKIRGQAESFGAKFVLGEIDSVKKIDSTYEVVVGDSKYFGRSLILALGTEHRKLDIVGEKKFIGKGVSYCATCDGNFFRDKTVVVVGGADSAAKAALYLSDICKRVYVIYRRHEMRCEPVSLEKIELNENIEVIYHSIPEEIIGEGVVTGLKIKTDRPDKDIEEKTIDCDGVFIEIGATPLNDLVSDLELEKDCDGYIITDKDARTNLAGVFGAGDNTNNHFKQMVTASAEGSVAAKSAHDFLMSLK